MSGLIRVVPEALDLDPAIRQGRVETFDAYLGALKGVEADAKRKHEARVNGKYAEWSGLLQSVNSQFELIAGVFRQIQDSTDSWLAMPSTGKVWTNDTTSGYVFGISLEGYTHVRVEDGKRRFHRREPNKKLTFNWGRGFGHWENITPTLDGKDRGSALGDEWQDLRLPPFYALEHTDIDNASLVAKAEEYIEGGQYRETKSWLREKLLQGPYSLSSFYNREPALNRLLDQVRNHLVIVTAQHGREKRREGIEVGLFCDYDIEHVVKGMFVEMTKGEFPSTTEHLN